MAKPARRIPTPTPPMAGARPADTTSVTSATSASPVPDSSTTPAETGQPIEKKQIQPVQQEHTAQQNTNPVATTPATTITTTTTTTTTSTECGSVITVPEYFYLVDVNHLTHMIADMLTRLISHNDLIPLTPSTLTRFHSRAPPSISVTDYLRRIVKYTSTEKACLLIILIYIDRVCEHRPGFTISSLTVHRFLITAITVSSKAICDSYCTNSHYAKVGGISTGELNTLELEFLTLIDWHLAGTGEMLQSYYVNLVRQHACYKRDVPIKSEFGRSIATGEDHAEAGTDVSRHFQGLIADDKVAYIA